jgi:hypothetical protein
MNQSNWAGDIDALIARLELRLEQYQLHAETLARHSRDRAGADAIVQGYKTGSMACTSGVVGGKPDEAAWGREARAGAQHE